MRKFNIALTFDEDTNNVIISFANELYKVLESDVILGANSNPHMTIGQFIAEDKIAKNIWENYKAIVNELPKINLAGISILPTDDGELWIEISVLKSQALLRLQNELIKIIAPYGELANDIDDNYRPHITIAHTTHGFDLPKFRLDFKALRAKNIYTQLGIGLDTKFETLVF